MNKGVSRILIALSVMVLTYFAAMLIASIVQIADAADRIYLGAGLPVFWFLIVTFVAVLAAPIVLVLRLPKPLIPPPDSTGPSYEAYLEAYRLRLKQHPMLRGDEINTAEDISTALNKLSQEADKVIKETASTVFVSTAVMQNGRLDGFVVLATQLRMVWKIASIYYQRPSPRQMLYLYSNVGAAALVADNIQEVDFSELATPIVVSILPSLKGAVPGLQGISTLLVNSLANGAANAFLTLRVGIVARQYCESLSKPARQEVRHSATLSALGLVGSIVKENGTQIVQRTWKATFDAFGNVLNASMEGIKDSTGKAIDATVDAAKSIGNTITSKVSSFGSSSAKSDDIDYEGHAV